MITCSTCVDILFPFIATSQLKTFNLWFLNSLLFALSFSVFFFSYCCKILSLKMYKILPLFCSVISSLIGFLHNWNWSPFNLIGCSVLRPFLQTIFCLYVSHAGYMQKTEHIFVYSSKYYNKAPPSAYFFLHHSSERNNTAWRFCINVII